MSDEILYTTSLKLGCDFVKDLTPTLRLSNVHMTKFNLTSQNI